VPAAKPTSATCQISRMLQWLWWSARWGPQPCCPQCRGRRLGSVHGDRPGDAQSQFSGQYNGLYLARRVAPVTASLGTIIVTGNTSAQRGRANFAGFAPTKAAQRILAEAMARDLGPKGVHVAYIVIDAVIDVPWTRERFKTKPDEFFIAPAAIADEAWHVASQPRSAWSFNVEIRPYGETW